MHYHISAMAFPFDLKCESVTYSIILCRGEDPAKSLRSVLKSWGLQEASKSTIPLIMKASIIFVTCSLF